MAATSCPAPTIAASVGTANSGVPMKTRRSGIARSAVIRRASGVEWIDQFDAKISKVRGVARSQNRALCARNCCDQTVHEIDAPPLFLAFSSEIGIFARGGNVKRPYPTEKRLTFNFVYR